MVETVVQHFVRLLGLPELDTGSDSLVGDTSKSECLGSAESEINDVMTPRFYSSILHIIDYSVLSSPASPKRRKDMVNQLLRLHTVNR
jgi:hypothetical protein